MGVREWDRKVKKLRDDLISTGRQYSPAKFREEQNLRWMQKKLENMQQDLEKKLAVIQSLSAHRSFLSESEKALLHWARKFADKARDYYREHAGLLHETYWARLAYTRSVHFSGYPEEEGKKGGKKPGQKTYHQKLRETRRELEKVSKDLQKRRLRLDQRYHYLAIVRANRDASVPGDCYEDLNVLGNEISIRGAGFGSGGAALEYIRTDSLNQLGLCRTEGSPDGRRQPEKAYFPADEPLRDSWAALKKFDYLNLDEDPEASGPSGLVAPG